MAHTINFRNVIQAALFSCELSGQISDGQWENTKPYDHWKVWCDANVNVNPSNVGVNFWAQKNNYNFATKDLLDVVGERMLNIANMAENNIPLEAINDFNDYNLGDFNYSDREGSTYWADKRSNFIEYFGSFENFQDKCKGSYDMKRLRAELKDMMQIVRKQINNL